MAETKTQERERAADAPASQDLSGVVGPPSAPTAATVAANTGGRVECEVLIATREGDVHGHKQKATQTVQVGSRQRAVCDQHAAMFHGAPEQRAAVQFVPR